MDARTNKCAPRPHTRSTMQLPFRRILVQYSLHMSDGQTITVNAEDFGKVIGQDQLCPVVRQDAKNGHDRTVWVDRKHIAWVSRIETK